MEENIAFGLRVKKVPENQVKERVTELLELIGCSGIEKRFSSQLSGDSAGVLLSQERLPQILKIFFLDELFAAIDAKVRLELRSCKYV